MRTESDRESSRRHYERNAEKRKGVTRAWRLANPEKWAAYMREYRRRRKAGNGS